MPDNGEVPEVPETQVAGQVIVELLANGQLGLKVHGRISPVLALGMLEQAKALIVMQSLKPPDERSSIVLPPPGTRF